MTKHFGIAIFAFGALLLAVEDSHAQFGGLKKLVGGGDESAEAAPVELPTPEKLEADLTANIQLNLSIMASIFDALGEKEQSELAEKNAACLEKGECGVADALGASQKSSKDLKDLLAAREKSETKLEPEQGEKFIAAFGRGIEWVVSGVAIIKTIKAISKDKMGAAKTYGAKTMGLLPKFPPVVTSNVSTISSGLKYATFSGLDTSAMQTQLTEATADL